jgi:hypothetical protein
MKLSAQNLDSVRVKPDIEAQLNSKGFRWVTNSSIADRTIEQIMQKFAYLKDAVIENHAFDINGKPIEKYVAIYARL